MALHFTVHTVLQLLSGSAKCNGSWLVVCSVFWLMPPQPNKKHVFGLFNYYTIRYRTVKPSANKIQLTNCINTTKTNILVTSTNNCDNNSNNKSNNHHSNCKTRSLCLSKTHAHTSEQETQRTKKTNIVVKLELEILE